MTEPIRHPGRRLGRRAPKRAPALKLSAILTGTVPQHPVTADHLSRVQGWELGGNDQFGTCGPTYVANTRRQLVAYLAPGRPVPTLTDVYDLYRRSGNARFDPSLPADDPRQDDNGVDMQTMLEEVHRAGIGGVRCLGFASVDVTNLDEVRAAISIFGDVGFGVNLQVAQRVQTDTGVWDYHRSSLWGGHAIAGGRYSSRRAGDDIDVVSWAKVIGTTDAFLHHQLEEAWVVIWEEHLLSQAFQQGIDQAALAAAYKAITGRDFPAPIIPSPAPGPSPTPSPPPGPPAAPPPAPPGGWEWLQQLAQWLQQRFGG